MSGAFFNRVQRRFLGVVMRCMLVALLWQPVSGFAAATMGCCAEQQPCCSALLAPLSCNSCGAPAVATATLVGGRSRHVAAATPPYRAPDFQEAQRPAPWRPPMPAAA